MLFSMFTDSFIFKCARLVIIAGIVSNSYAQEDAENIVDLESYTVRGYTNEITDTFSNSSKLSVPVVETPRSLSIINRLRIEDIGALSIQDSLSYLTGVIAAPYGVDSRLDAARIRGVSPLKFHDGFQALFGSYNNTRTEIYTLEQIEVLKGPSSVLFGRGALGGVVNSVSKLPQFEKIQEIELQIGSFDRKQLAMDFGGKLTPSGSLLYRMVAVNRDSETQVDHIRDDVTVLMPSLTWQPSSNTHLTFLANFQENKGGQTLQFLPNEGTLLNGQQIPTSTFVGEPDWDRYDTKQKAYSFFFDHQFNDQLSISVNARYTDGEGDYKSHWVAYDGADPIIAIDGTINRTIYDAPASSEAFVWNARLDAHFSTGLLNHRLGVELDAQDVTNDTDSYYGWAAGNRINIYNPVYGNLATVYPVNDTPAEISEQIGFSIRDHMTYEQWILFAGIRHDKVKSHNAGSETKLIDESATTGDIGLMYQFKNGLNPYFSWAESFEPLGSTTGLDGSKLQLDPKRGTQYEIGLKYQPSGSKTLYTLSFFDLTEFERPISNGIFVRQEDVKTKGFEFEAQTNWKDFFLQAGYSYVDAHETNGYHIVTVPEHQFVSWFTYDPKEGLLKPFRVGTGLRYTGKTWDGTDSYNTEPVTLIDVMIGYDAGRTQIRLNINNLSDKSYVASTQGGRSFYGARRNISLTAKFTF